MQVKPDRLGKVAILAAISSREEEEEFKKYLAANTSFKVALTFVSGVRTDVGKTFVKSLVSCALQGKVVQHRHNEIHAVIHAGLECLKGVSSGEAAENQSEIEGRHRHRRQMAGHCRAWRVGIPSRNESRAHGVRRDAFVMSTAIFPWTTPWKMEFFLGSGKF